MLFRTNNDTDRDKRLEELAAALRAMRPDSPVLRFFTPPLQRKEQRQ